MTFHYQLALMLVCGEINKPHHQIIVSLLVKTNMPHYTILII